MHVLIGWLGWPHMWDEMIKFELVDPVESYHFQLMRTDFQHQPELDLYFV